MVRVRKGTFVPAVPSFSLATPQADVSKHFIGTPSADGILKAFLDFDCSDTAGPPLDPDFDAVCAKAREDDVAVGDASTVCDGFSSTNTSPVSDVEKDSSRATYCGRLALESMYGDAACDEEATSAAPNVEVVHVAKATPVPLSFLKPSPVTASSARCKEFDEEYEDDFEVDSGDDQEDHTENGGAT